MAQTLGLIEMVWRGTKVPVEKGGTIMLGGLQNNVVITGKTVDYAHEYAASEVTATTKLGKGQSLLALWADGPGELQVLCDTGQTFVWPDAFLKNRPKATAGEGGKVEIQFAGGEPEEIVNG